MKGRDQRPEADDTRGGKGLAGRMTFGGGKDGFDLWRCGLWTQEALKKPAQSGAAGPRCRGSRGGGIHEGRVAEGEKADSKTNH